jgi:small subunit ribosomal protein S17
MSTDYIREELEGVVLSSKGDKSISVSVPMMVQHPKYRKYLTKNRVFHAHDEGNEASEGDRVVIRKCRPMSKTKHWRLQKIVKRADTV